MTTDAAGEGPPTPPTGASVSSLSDGAWHRVHPLTPLLRGGLVFVVAAGIIIANLRERLVVWFFPAFQDDVEGELPPDPLEYVWEHELAPLVLVGVIALFALLLGMFHLSWRFRTFRITDDDVEVRSGVLFRTQRRAPLDRVQGVNLIRPLLARVLGMAKLEVVGAGADGGVTLEYLSTANAEAVRADILRLASGRRLIAAGEAAGGGVAGARASRVAGAVNAVGEGVAGLVSGVDNQTAEPESVVTIPVGRLIASRLLSVTTLVLVALIVAIIVGSIVGSPWVLFGFVPALLGFGAYAVRSVTRALRYAIAPTRDGVRLRFGLFTTTTEILPPGRVHAVEVSQSIFWRPFGWWSVSVNRLSRRAATTDGADQSLPILPVGTRDDVERVLALLLPALQATEWESAVAPGIHRLTEGDPFSNTPRRAAWMRPLSWRRNGFLLTPDVLLLRRGSIWRKLVILPLARMQSIAITQGPIDRAVDVANLQAHTIAGPVVGSLGIVDRALALDLFGATETAAIAASAVDRSHRWADGSEGEGT